MIAPVLADTAIQSGEMSSSWRDDSSDAVTSMISPGSGTPRLSTPITRPTAK